MIGVSAFASIGLFVAGLWLFGVIRVSAGVLTVARQAVAAMRDPSLDDAAREKHVQRASLRLMGAFVSILARSLLCLLVSALPIWLASVAGLANVDEVLQFLARWDVIVLTSAAMIAGYLLWVRLWPSRRITPR